jgi:hypothetical protein
MTNTAHSTRPPVDMDLLAEEWALQLVEERSIASENVVFRANGSHGRSHRKDILKARRRTLSDGFEEALFLELRRNGTYDNLPEALFHEVGSAKSMPRNAEADKDAKSARDFFLPFEQEPHRLRMVLRTYEQRLLSQGMEEQHGRDLAALWMIPVEVEKADRSALLKVLPLATVVTGDLKATAACFEYVIGQQVRITLQDPASMAIPTSLQASLGGAALGGDLMSGDRFQDGWYTLLVSISEVPVMQMASTKERHRLNLLARVLGDHFLPAHLETTVELLVGEKENGLRLGDAQNPAVLAMNTSL